MSARVVAHVDLDAFFASVEQLLEPRLAGKPVVVGGAAGERGVVASASYEARARGIYVPMPLTRAYRQCPEAHFLPGRHEHYRDFSVRVFDVCDGSSPQVERAGIDEGFLDWTMDQWASLHPHRRPSVHWPLELAERLRDTVMERVGLSVSVGIGANRLIAKLAGKYCKPRGICHVAAGAERAFLRPLRLRAVPGIGPRSAEILSAHGLVRVGDVQSTPYEVLVAGLGEPWADKLRRLAKGEGSSRLTVPGAPKSVSGERTFRSDCHDLDQVRRVLYRLVEKAAWRLRRAGLRAGTCAVKLRTADFRTYTRARSLGFRSDCHRELYVLASELLSGLMRRPHPVRLVGVHLSNLDTSGGGQLTLFGQDDRATGRRVDRVLDLVRERFGFQTIATAGAL